MLIRSSLLSLLCGAVCAGAALAGPVEDQAKRLLEDAGATGGLIVHVGCGDGQLTAALGADPQFVVHGLDADSGDVAAARAHIQKLRRYGRVSVAPHQGKRLPYAGGLVNVLVVEKPCLVPADEIHRVLAPLGVAFVRHGEDWRKMVQPRPEELDPWTHFLHDAGGNAVSHDARVGPPRRLRWESGPRWCRSHEFPSSVNAAVSAGGRIFCILDEGPIGVYKNLPQDCRLVARDAANGLLLWKHPMRQWSYEHGTGLGDRWHIHQTLPRRLVASEDKVFVTLSFNDSPVSVFDAATGKILVEGLQGTEGADEILVDGDLLAVKITDSSPSATKALFARDVPASLAVVDLDTQKLLWRKDDLRVAPYAVALHDGHLVFHNLAEIVCLDAKSCKEQWRVERDAERIPGAGSTLVVHDGVVLHHFYRRAPGPKPKRGRGRMEALITAVDLASGEALWTAKGGVGLAAACTEPTDIFVAGGLVWCGPSREGRDLRTGEVKKTLELAKLISPGHHYRCYRSKATDRFLLYPKRGTEFVDLEGEGHMRNDWIRAPCYTGVMPANGLLYVPPSQCFCYPGVKLAGFLALEAEGRSSGRTIDENARLVRGPAYGKDSPLAAGAAKDDWPMYRHDPLRSGATAAAVPEDLKTRWEVTLACPAAQPVVVGGRVLLAEKDAHRIRCLKAADGSPEWDFTAAGRIDSAPTVHGELVLFGCRDGSVYCLRAADGELVWRFLAAPRERLITSFGQLESAWPVHGSVLVQNGVCYVAAGRSSFLDGGIDLFALDPPTGKVLHKTHLEGPWPDIQTDTGRPFDMEGARADLLVSDGEHLHMQRIKLDASLKRLQTPQITPLGDLDMGGKHLLCTGGFLDDSAFDRLFWQHTSRWPGFYFAQQAPKSGQLIVFDDQAAYTVKYFYRRHALSPGFIPGEEGYLVFADDLDNEPILVGPDGKPEAIEWLPESARTQGRYDISNRATGVEKGVGYTRGKPPRWQTMAPVRVRAMVLAGDRLIVAGPPDVVDADDPYAALEGRNGAVLQVHSAASGEVLASQKLASAPVFDGLSAAGARLYLATADGKVMCLGGK